MAFEKKFLMERGTYYTSMDKFKFIEKLKYFATSRRLDQISPNIKLSDIVPQDKFLYVDHRGVAKGFYKISDLEREEK